MTNVLTVLDLFSGAGGVHMAMERTGTFRTIAFSEINKHAAATLKRRFPSIPNLGDITKICEFPAADIISGGFPCQDLSVAGTGVGLSGARSGLWFHMLDAIRQTKPRGVLIENVAILRSRGLDIVLHGLSEAGYDAEWYILPAAAVGAPHKRERIYIVAYRKCAGGQRLVEAFRPCESRQWNWCGQADLQSIADSPFVPGTRWPRPLLRRVDDGMAGRAHRLTQIGNGVVIPVVFQIAQLLYCRVMERWWGDDTVWP